MCLLYLQYVIGSLGQETANRPCGHRVYCHLLNKTTSRVIATTTKERTTKNKIIEEPLSDEQY